MNNIHIKLDEYYSYKGKIMASAKLFPIQITYSNKSKEIYLKEKDFKFFTPKEIKQIFECYSHSTIKNDTLKTIKETLHIITARKKCKNFYYGNGSAFMRDVVLPNYNIEIDTTLFNRRLYMYNYAEGTTRYVYTSIFFEFDDKNFSKYKTDKTIFALKRFLKDLIKIFLINEILSPKIKKISKLKEKHQYIIESFKKYLDKYYNKNVTKNILMDYIDATEIKNEIETFINNYIKYNKKY